MVDMTSAVKLMMGRCVWRVTPPRPYLGGEGDSRRRAVLGGVGHVATYDERIAGANLR